MRLTLSAFCMYIVATSAMAQVTAPQSDTPVSDAELQAILDNANEQVEEPTHDQKVGYTLPLEQIPLYEGQASAPNAHVIAEGDTLYGLSKRYGVSIEALQQANELNDYHLSLGSSLRIPEIKTVPVQPEPIKAAPIKAEPVRADIQVSHVVQSGDTLYGIARHYCVTSAALNTANPGLRADRLSIGATVALPQGHCTPKTMAKR